MPPTLTELREGWEWGVGCVLAEEIILLYGKTWPGF